MDLLLLLILFGAIWYCVAIFPWLNRMVGERRGRFRDTWRKRILNDDKDE